jgi:hypothetical protein
VNFLAKKKKKTQKTNSDNLGKGYCHAQTWLLDIRKLLCSKWKIYCGRFYLLLVTMFRSVERCEVVYSVKV